MAYIAKRVRVRPLALSLVLATIVGLGLLGFRGNTKPVAAGQSGQWSGPARAAAVVEFFTAKNGGDVEAAMAQFADNGIWASSSPADACYLAHPCIDAVGIRAQLQRYIEIQPISQCQTVIQRNCPGGSAWAWWRGEAS